MVLNNIFKTRKAMAKCIDINCDVGEGAAYDLELMAFISSANISCGKHAGDEFTMRRAIEAALKQGVSIGAHPGFADRENFGRTLKRLSEQEVYSLVLDQIKDFCSFAEKLGARVNHVKPHGALYNLVAVDKPIARALLQAVYDYDPTLIVYGLAGSNFITEARLKGLTCLEEMFSDRSYESDGTLTPRSMPNAVLADADSAVKQVLSCILSNQITSREGEVIVLKADTVCLHGDNPHGLEIARLMHRLLLQAQIEIKAFQTG
jgi:5-oxoprolinase (ATP-hydrolysing) subunit A